MKISVKGDDGEHVLKAKRQVENIQQLLVNCWVSEFADAVAR